MKLISILFLCLVMVCSVQAEDMTHLSPEQAYNIGKDLALHVKTEEAKPYLKYAADKGNVNAMFRYADLIAGMKLIMPDEARKYMKMAAENGHEMALLDMYFDVLSNESEKQIWKEKLLDKIQPYVEKKNPDALYLMSVLYHKDHSEREDWLVKAVDAGSCQAMVDLADFYSNGHGWFLLPWRRDHKAMTLYQQAAKKGCSKGIYAYAYALDAEGGPGAGMPQWQRLIDQGDAKTIISIAMDYGDPSIIINTPKKKPFDLYHSALFFKIYLDGVGNVSGEKDSYEATMDYYNETMAKLSPQQQQKVLADAKTYLQHHELKNIDEIWEMKFQ